MAILLAIVAYAALLVFISGVIWRAVVYTRGGSSSPLPGAVRRPIAVVMALLDIFVLKRLLAANKGIWPGELVFHVSFIVLFLGHLVLFFSPVARSVDIAVKVLPYAGLALVGSLLYIIVYRLLIERAKFVSSYNLLISGTIFFLGATGLLIGQVFRTDVAKAKEFLVGIYSLSIGTPPPSWLFFLHFTLAFAVLAFLPTHIFTAPFITVYARWRQRETESILHPAKVEKESLQPVQVEEESSHA